MRNTNRALAAAAVGALAALTLSTAPALAATNSAGYKNCAEAAAAGVYNIPASSPDYRKALDSDGDGIACEKTAAPINTGSARTISHQRTTGTVPDDPTTCSDALTSLVKVRTTENGLGARISVLEQEDKIAAKALRSAQQADKEAQATRDAKIAAANSQYTNVDRPAADAITDNPKTPVDEHAVALQNALDKRNNAIAAANAAYASGGTAAALVKAQHEYDRTHSALLDVRAHLGDAHNAVARITIIIGKLCNQTPPPPPVETTTEAPAPPVDTTPAPSNNGTVIVNNPQIGQVPTGSNTGGGAEAANVE